jgi:hypothetical protein
VLLDSCPPLTGLEVCAMASSAVLVVGKSAPLTP